MSDPTRFQVNGRSEGPSVELLNELFDDAIRLGASDIHFEDGDQGCAIRFRVGGELRQIRRIDHQTALMCDSKIRAVCRMSLQERYVPLDGRMFIEVDDRIVDVRVSIVPTRSGQSIACRLLDQNNASRRLEQIEMSDTVRAAIASVLDEPDGLILLTGPTGSGKTTTLYSILNQLNRPEVKIVTVEDPVEYRLEGVNQINVDDRFTFATALRSILRQDPDIILVGEIRDAETAKIAVEASMTGHLVLASLHANDMASTMTRLVDLGVDKHVLSIVLRCVIAQRLPKQLCPHCAEPHTLTAGEREWLTVVAAHYLDRQYFSARGCDQCKGGTSERIPVMEMVVGGAAMRRAIGLNTRAEIIRAARLQKQYETIVDAGLRHALNGRITLAEVKKLSRSLDEVPCIETPGAVPQGNVLSLLAERTGAAAGERR